MGFLPLLLLNHHLPMRPICLLSILCPSRVNIPAPFPCPLPFLPYPPFPLPCRHFNFSSPFNKGFLCENRCLDVFTQSGVWKGAPTVQESSSIASSALMNTFFPHSSSRLILGKNKSDIDKCGFFFTHLWIMSFLLIPKILYTYDK